MSYEKKWRKEIREDTDIRVRTDLKLGIEKLRDQTALTQNWGRMRTLPPWTLESRLGLILL